MIKKIVKQYYPWVLAIIVTTALSGLIYASAQQILRQDGNDPQVVIAEDTASFLNSGQKIESILPINKVDPSISLVPFVIDYNDNGEVVASAVNLDNTVPALPKGVLDNVKARGENRLTWEPKAGVRIAAVVTKFNGGYILAGRSLKETEARIDNLGQMILLGWFVTFLAISLTTFLYTKLSK